MPKLNEKKDAIWIGFWRMPGQAGGHRGGSLTDLRSDQEREFQENRQHGLRQGRAGFRSFRDARRPLTISILMLARLC